MYWWETLQQEHANHGGLRQDKKRHLSMLYGDTEQYLYTKDLGDDIFQKLWEKVVAGYK